MKNHDFANGSFGSPGELKPRYKNYAVGLIDKTETKIELVRRLVDLAV